MPSFAHRSAEREIIDDVVLPEDEQRAVVRNLDAINRYLGGYRVTASGVARLLPSGARTATVLDVGAGAADGARALVVQARRRGVELSVTALDRDGTSLGLARERRGSESGVSLLQADALALPFAERSFDIATCSLMLHHLDDTSAAQLLRVLFAVSRHGVVLNDLHRHRLAWLGIVAATRLFGACATVCHDGPLSVRRAFTRADIEALARETGLPIETRWRWAFRYELLIRRQAG